MGRVVFRRCFVTFFVFIFYLFDNIFLLRIVLMYSILNVFVFTDFSCNKTTTQNNIY